MKRRNLKGVKGLLLDLDGTVYIGKRPIPRAAEALGELRKAGYPLRFTTNTTTLSIASLQAKLDKLHLGIEPNEVFGAIKAAISYLKKQGNPTCHLLLSDDPKQDFAQFVQSETPDILLIGDIGKYWDYELMNRLFRIVMGGAEMVALHKGRYWQTENGLQVDIGAFVAGLEYVTGKTATVIGKPSKSFFELALSDLELEASQVAMAGDDLVNDVAGAQAAGMRGVLVKTGKYRKGDLDRHDIFPDLVIDSIADLPGMLSHSA